MPAAVGGLIIGDAIWVAKGDEDDARDQGRLVCFALPFFLLSFPWLVIKLLPYINKECKTGNPVAKRRAAGAGFGEVNPTYFINTACR
jgi:hypothetical protein